MKIHVFVVELLYYKGIPSTLSDAFVWARCVDAFVCAHACEMCIDFLQMISCYLTILSLVMIRSKTIVVMITLLTL